MAASKSACESQRNPYLRSSWWRTERKFFGGRLQLAGRGANLAGGQVDRYDGAAARSNASFEYQVRSQMPTELR